MNERQCHFCNGTVDFPNDDIVILSGYYKHDQYFCDAGCYQAWSDYEIHEAHEINESAYCGSGGK